MSAALIALLLIRLDAHVGDWCPVADLARHLAVPEPVARLHLEHIAADASNRVALQYDEWGYVLAAALDPVACLLQRVDQIEAYGRPNCVALEMSP